MGETSSTADWVLVTGAGRRIGRTLALEFAAWGYAVAVHYNSSCSEALETVGEIRAGGGRAEAVQADLAEIADVEALVPDLNARLGPITCLVNNASEFLEDDLATLSPERWQRHLDVNLRAPVFLAKAFAAQLGATGPGNIINLIDQRVRRPTPEFFSYSVSKAGLWAATRMLAQALAPRVRVNGIGPGPVLASVYQSEDQFARQCAATPLGRGTRPTEIARAVRFILDAPAMTGQMIILDGGQHIAWQTPDGADGP